jgi:hypothetical protein
MTVHGTLNIQVDGPYHVLASQFLDLLIYHNFLFFPCWSATHSHGHTLAFYTTTFENPLNIANADAQAPGKCF